MVKNTIDYRGFMPLNLGSVSNINFPSVDDMQINSKSLIDELKKLIDENDIGLSMESIDAGVKLAITVVEKMQKAAYQDFVSQCKLTQV